MPYKLTSQKRFDALLYDLIVYVIEHYRTGVQKSFTQIGCDISFQEEKSPCQKIKTRERNHSINTSNQKNGPFLLQREVGDDLINKYYYYF